jgi:hypothetical protein
MPERPGRERWSRKPLIKSSFADFHVEETTPGSPAQGRKFVPQGRRGTNSRPRRARLPSKQVAESKLAVSKMTYMIAGFLEDNRVPQMAAKGRGHHHLRPEDHEGDRHH